MRSLLNFSRDNPVLIIAMVASILMLIFGLLLIKAPHIFGLTEPVPAVAAPAAEDLFSKLPSLPEVDQSPPADLPTLQAALQEMTKGTAAAKNITAKELADALAESRPGSEIWCDLMLIKPDADWTSDESEIFAQNCI